MNILNVELRNAVESETPERQKKANKKLQCLVSKIRQPQSKIYDFMATVSIMLQLHVNINAISTKGRKLLSKISKQYIQF
jgi:hypothetical protein